MAPRTAHVFTVPTNPLRRGLRVPQDVAVIARDHDRFLEHVTPFLASRPGFTPEEVEKNAAAIMQGEEAPTPVVIGDRPYTIPIRFPAAARASLEVIQNTIL